MKMSGKILTRYSEKYRATETKDICEAIPVFIDSGEKVVFMAPGSNVICIQDDSEFAINKINALKIGQRICLRLTDVGDFLDELARYTNAVFSTQSRLPLPRRPNSCGY